MRPDQRRRFAETHAFLTQELQLALTELVELYENGEIQPSIEIKHLAYQIAYYYRLVNGIRGTNDARQSDSRPLSAKQKFRYLIQDIEQMARDYLHVSPTTPQYYNLEDIRCLKSAEISGDITKMEQTEIGLALRSVQKCLQKIMEFEYPVTTGNVSGTHIPNRPSTDRSVPDADEEIEGAFFEIIQAWIQNEGKIPDLVTAFNLMVHFIESAREKDERWADVLDAIQKPSATQDGPNYALLASAAKYASRFMVNASLQSKDRHIELKKAFSQMAEMFEKNMEA